LYTTTSVDGTRIAYDRSGAGPAVVLVGGAFSYRRFPKAVQLAELLSEQFTVFNYDRRGRGDSGDAGRYTVDREIEDLAAVIDAAGGTASVWGWSSGAVLALRASAAGVPIERLALYEPPFIVDDGHRRPPPDLGQRLEDHLAAGDRGAAVRLYLTEAMGAPRFFVRMMRVLPVWSRLEAVAHTLPYDWAVLGDALSGRPLDVALWGRVEAPALVLAGSKSPALLQDAARAISAVLPAGVHRVLEGQSHNPSMKVQAPVLAAFLGAPAAGDFPREWAVNPA
jgi:alpha-beta hydrolase superfamily lysophospholipase